MSELQNVVLTGLGAITSRGDATLRGGNNLSGETASDFSITNFALENYLASPKTYLDRCSALSLGGAALALKDAGIETPVGSDDFGITLGTHFGCVETMKIFWDKALEKGARLANPLLFSHSYFNSPISLCAIEFGLKGYHGTFCAGEDSGIEAVRAAFDAIRLGHAEAMVCGGVDAVSPTRELCAPSENGKMGEASVFFVLESQAHAQRRGTANPLAIDEAWLTETIELSEIKAQFGDCGGAESVLPLVQRALKFTRI